jgi:hypothetical protein
MYIGNRVEELMNEICWKGKTGWTVKSVQFLDEMKDLQDWIGHHQDVIPTQPVKGGHTPRSAVLAYYVTDNMPKRADVYHLMYQGKASLYTLSKILFGD